MKSTKPILIAAVIIAALILLGAHSDKPTYTIRTVTVEPGGQLWDYWDGKMNYSEWLYEMKQLNGEKATLLHSGDTIKVLEVVQ